MLALVGAFVVLACVIGGFMMEGGHIAVLIQPIELLIIGGSAAGSLLISSPISLLKAMMGQVLGIITKKGGPGTEDYMVLLTLLFEILKTAKTNPMAIEPHIEDPEKSEIFKKYPSIVHNHHLMDFICDTLRVLVSSSMSPYDLEDLMDVDLGALHEEEHKIPATISRIGDAMPGLGIVAAVLGVVITMGKLTEGKEVIGHSVAAALVGTFLGILLSYGFMQPLSARIESNNANESKLFVVVKSALIAYAKNCAPKLCVEFARRSIPPSDRPDFAKVDKATSAAGK